MNVCRDCTNWHEHANGIVGSCITEGMPVRVKHGQTEACSMFDEGNEEKGELQ